MIRLEDDTNFGCQLRDGIYKNMDRWKVGGTVHMSLVKKSIEKISIPKKYWCDVMAMVEYRKYDRVTDWVEQLLEGLIIRDIVNDIINEELSGMGIRLINKSSQPD